MAKVKTSKKRKKSLPRGLVKFEPDHKLLADKKLVLEVLIDALLTNDIDTFRDVLVAHLRTVSMSKLAKKTGLGRRTLYDLMDEKTFDPRLSTLSALLSKISA